MDIIEMMRGQQNQERDTPMDATTAKSQIGLLKDFHRSFNMVDVNDPFRAGDIVSWKDGMKYCNFPRHGQYAIVHEVLTEPKQEESVQCYAVNTIRIGCIATDTYVIYDVDGRRFKKVK